MQLLLLLLPLLTLLLLTINLLFFTVREARRVVAGREQKDPTKERECWEKIDNDEDGPGEIEERTEEKTKLENQVKIFYSINKSLTKPLFSLKG